MRSDTSQATAFDVQVMCKYHYWKNYQQKFWMREIAFNAGDYAKYWWLEYAVHYIHLFWDLNNTIHCDLWKTASNCNVWNNNSKNHWIYDTDRLTQVLHEAVSL